jgi:hypothetical protein
VTPAVLVLAAVLLLAAGACGKSDGGGENTKPSGETTMTSDSQDSFKTPFEVRPDYRSRTRFSPTLPADETGLLIAAPDEAPWNPQQRVGADDTFCYLPISLAYRFSLEFIDGVGEQLTDKLTVMAVDAATGESYSGLLMGQDYEPDEPADDDGEDTANTFVRGYFTFNLAFYLPLPEGEARYHVHVSLGDIQSNVVEIAVVKAGR